MTTQTTNNADAQATSNPLDTLSMEQYAAMREAEMRGEKPAQNTAAAAQTTADNATDEDTDDAAHAAANTESDEDGSEIASESATDENEPSNDDQLPKGKKGIKVRFSELTAEKKELQAAVAKREAELEAAKQEADEARAEAERLRLEAERARNAIPQVPSEDEDPAPNRSDFDDPDEYVAALSAHTSRNEIRRAAKSAKEAAEARAEEARKAADESRQAEAQKAVQALHATFNKRVEEVRPEYPDYDEKVTNNESLVLRNDVFFSVEKATDSPHILYHLANHPEEAKSLNNMDPYSAAMRIGEIQAELRVARKPKPSRAAEPIKPVGNRQSPLPKSPDEMTADEYAEWSARQAQASGRRKGRVNLI